MIITNKKIRIVSGEGEMGTAEEYVGKMTPRAIKSRLTRERCNGDRWAKAVQYSHTNDHGDVGFDLETGEPCTWPVID